MPLHAQQYRGEHAAHAQLEHDVLSALAVCVRLSQAGCGILSANIHDGLPEVTVDRRPDLPDMTPGRLYADLSGAYYRARLGNVGVAWTEARRAA